MWSLISTALTQIIIKAREQGFSVLLLLLACGGLSWLVFTMAKVEREQREKAIIELQRQIQDCNNQVIEYYREDKIRSDEIILRNTIVLERLEKTLSNGR